MPRPSPRKRCVPPAFSVGPLYELERGQQRRAGVLVVGDGSVPPRPFWDLLERLALHAGWLVASFSLQTRPQCYGVARAEGSALAAGFRGVWHDHPRFTLVLATLELSEAAVRAEVQRTLTPSVAPAVDDPFPRWQPGDPPTALLEMPELGAWS